MLDLPLLHARARRRRARVVVDAALADAAATAAAEGLVAEAPSRERFEALLLYTETRVDAAVLDGEPPGEGATGVYLLLGRRLLLAAPPEALRDAARQVARLGADPEAAALLGADPQLAREVGLVARAAGATGLPPGASLVYGPPDALKDVVNEMLFAGASPLAAVRLDVARPLVTVIGDPVEAVALAAALVE